jgi:transcriptional regulator with XRE-family HTH domain
MSNPYLSQLERGMHQPSVRVLNLLSGALDVSAEMLLAQAGLLDLHPADAPSADAPPPATSVQEAIRADDQLNDEQKSALLAVYRSMLR